MAIKPSLPKGTRDFLPEAMIQRQHILGIIRSVFKKYGFLPIETPAMEMLSTLTGKYGDEGDKLIFKILKSGDYLADADEKALENKDFASLLPMISSKALRYDLTVPFARFVVQNRNDLHFPFKRYQMQPVWRADRPQIKMGRFQEFYQCDADVVGSDSLLFELELIRIYAEVFNTLKIPCTIKLNNRKVLMAFGQKYGIADRLVDFTVALDKLDKIGVDGVRKQLEDRGFGSDVISGFEKLTSLEGGNEAKLQEIKSLLEGEDPKGVEELDFLIANADISGFETVSLELDFTLARGLNYYTGAIFEVVASDVKVGSIGGGGRYDDLTGIFGMEGVSGVGISFGLDRIHLVLEELGLIEVSAEETTEVLLLNFGEKEALFSMKLANELRDLGVNAEVYPSSAKLKKQMSFANAKGVPYVIFIGSKEMEDERFTLKDMRSGEEEKFGRMEMLGYFSTPKDDDHGRS